MDFNGNSIPDAQIMVPILLYFVAVLYLKAQLEIRIEHTSFVYVLLVNFMYLGLCLFIPLFKMYQVH